MSKLKLQADREICVGAGMCVLTAPQIFDQDDQIGRVIVLRECTDEESENLVREAVALCPSGAITVVGSDTDDPGQDNAEGESGE